MKRSHQSIFKIIFSVVLLFSNSIISQQLNSPNSAGVYFDGFSILPPYDEQVKLFNFYPDVRVQINIPAPEKFDITKPVGIALFATPNGNSIEHTFGKRTTASDDWHYNIQHIGAQTRFLRESNLDYNLVTVYLETSSQSWPGWRSSHSDNAQLIKAMVDSIKNIFAAYNPFVVLTGHSGGGSMTFGYMNSVANIPAYVKRITFLDSDYNYDNSYGAKILDWLNASPENHLCVIAYNDSVALLNGAPFVSPTGGTWYRSWMMQNYLKQYFQFTTEETSDFIKWTALEGRVKFFMKKNPTRIILHTVQVELNGFIHGMISGTEKENIGYEYFGSRAYSQYIQGYLLQKTSLTIPARPVNSKTGSEFMQYVNNMTFEQREAEILSEISKGNIPNFYRSLRTVRANFQDINGTTYKCYYEVMPDYLAIGSDSDYCRIPMGPLTAQTLANLFGATMPTPKLVDNIYTNTDLKVAPVTYAPVGNQNELVAKFVEHNTAIEQQRKDASKEVGVFMGGTKKDVVISNKITDGKVVIYGWHKLDGNPIQPVYNGHISGYVDYSHGIRFLNREIILDSVITTIPDILRDSVKYRILSNETGPMYQPSYFKELYTPEQPRSFGIKTENNKSLRIIVKPDTSVTKYIAKISKDGKSFVKTYYLEPDNLVITGLQTDTLFYVKLTAQNSAGDSPPSEILAGVPTDNVNSSLLIVNGFDRASTGNTYDFIRMHAPAFHKNGITSFCSATNDAVINGLFNLTDYSAVDYILGDESTADETFSLSEQSKVRTFLLNGGNLFVSGSEIAWDMDNKGNSTDKKFINEYLKAKYIADAPNSQSGVFYKVQSVNNPVIYYPNSFFFDNGTHGTINVKWPDVIDPVNGSEGLLSYVGLDTSSGFAGICYSGIFPGGTAEGKVITLGFPFETIYPQTTINEIAKNIINYFGIATSVESDNASVPDNFRLYQNYPNPFNPSTKIKFSIPAVGANSSITGGSPVQLKVYDVLGREVTTLINKELSTGNYEFEWDGSSLSSGIYFYELRTENFSSVKKMLLLK